MITFQLLKKIILSLSLLFCIQGFSQKTQRPFIWVEQSDREKILTKIGTQPWAKSFYIEFKKRLDDDISLYRTSPEQFLSKLPFDWSKQKESITPPLRVFEKSDNTNSDERTLQLKYLQIGIDCGVMYFLTEDESYAQCALDILYAHVEGLLQIKPSDDLGNGGWIYPDDHLREARVVGAQLPIIYDFVAPYIEKYKTAFDIGKKGLTVFSTENAQKVFLTYARLAAEHGQVGSNWSVLESFSLIQNALALNDLELREKYLNVYLKKGTSKQESLLEVSSRYKNEGDVFPETSQYSNDVANFATRAIIILDKYDSSLKLGKTHYKIPFSLDRWNSIRYPNNQIVRFGDGHRNFSVPYDSYEMAYYLGIQESIPQLTEKFGLLLNQGIKLDKYKREKVGNRSSSISVYFTPTELLWLDEVKDYSIENAVLPRTDTFSHAGIFLQRNLSSTQKPEDGLMCFVGGAHMVHGHAEGMNIELYGKGEVLGVDNGRGAYKTDLHENYSRLFAAHNTVIVNGSSRGEGNWVGLGINKVQLISMEPMPFKDALSPFHSFSLTSFLDDKGDAAEAYQERTLALIRTSPNTGYYVDVFRSKSKLPNQYHDYIYHNFGDKLKLINKDLSLKADKERYMANANGLWKNNGQYRNPGWHFFKDIESSNVYDTDVKATFEINQIKDESRYMKLYIIGNENREYTKVMAPNTFEAPKPYDKMPTPTLVIRQKGEAWTNPFAVIYEPTYSENSKNGIQTVSKLEKDGIFKGFKVISKIDNKEITQYIINQEQGGTYENKELGLYFKGVFAIITLDSKQELQNIYIGDGENLKYSTIKIESKDGKSIAAYVDFLSKETQFKATNNAKVILNK